MKKANQNRESLDPISIFLILIMNMVAAWALAATDWADHLAVIPVITFFAVFAASALASSIFPKWLVSIFGTVYGLFIIGRQLGAISQTTLIWRDRIFSLLGRVGVLITVIFRGETNQDPLMFVLLMAILFWLLGFVSAWLVLRRQNAWGAIILGGLAITFFNFYYYGNGSLGIFLGIYLLVSLLLATWVDLRRKNADWRSSRARVPTDTTYRTAIAGFIAAVALVGLTWTTPALARSEFAANAWEKITSPFEPIKDRVGDTLGNVRGPVPVMPSEYSDVLVLEGGEQPVNRFVMEVDPFQLPTGGGRFYWRSRVYEDYDGSQWTVPEVSIEKFDPTGPALPGPALDGRQLVEVSIAPKSAAIKQLYAPSQPVWSDRNIEVAVTKAEDQVVDVTAIRVEDYLYEGELYRVQSSLASPSEYQLRQAGEDYPGWVIERYLQVPESISDRVFSLAEQVTSELETPYDRALAITGWLRENIEYSRESEAPPPEVEPIDWFLFESQIGFCNYYASAEVILLRTIGIPARLAAGYARGTYKPSEGVYQVFGEDSHAWPEVYFPGIGWVEFEPTVSQPELERPEGGPEEERFGGSVSQSGAGDGVNPDDLVQDVEEIELGGEAGFSFSLKNPIFRRVLSFTLVFVSILLAWVRINPVTWMRTRRFITSKMNSLGMREPASDSLHATTWETPIGHTYRRLTAWLEKLDLLKGQSQTANERALAVAVALPESEAHIWAIVHAYERERFGAQVVDGNRVKDAWASLRWRFWLAWLWKITERWRREE